MNGTSNSTGSGFRHMPPGGVGWHLMITWTLGIILTALPGNIFVLWSSIKHNSIRLDNISTILIRHIALFNLGFTVYIASWTTLIMKRDNVYPAIICSLIRTWAYFCVITELLLVAGLSVSKLTCILSPLRAMARSKGLGRKLAATAWTVSAVWCLGNFLAVQLCGDPRVEFREATYECVVDPGNLVLERILKYTKTVFVSCAELVLFVSTVWLCKFVKKTTGHLHRQSLITTLLVSGTHLMSYIPSVLISHVLKRYILTNSQKDSNYFSVFYSMCQFLILFHCAINPVLYCFTVRSYGLFVRKFFTAFCEFVRNGKFELAEEKRSASKFIALHQIAMSNERLRIHELSSRTNEKP